MTSFSLEFKIALLRQYKVLARIYVSLNGHKPVLNINPIVDLAAEHRTLGRPPWLLRNNEPLPPREKRYQLDLFSL